ncbi:hypothetical protein C8Q79DRAFT_163509 [Trametes meyenii]|nr:hypothetical protein C8Q79DRAFT_163509 [Trametes meyenii]
MSTDVPAATPDNGVSLSSPTAAERFASYSFATDEEYQNGLSGIMASGVLRDKSDEEKAEILLRTEVFYFNRPSISIEDARRVRQNDSMHPAKTTEPLLLQEESPMLSFAQLKTLIEQGRTDEIPNNKIIPNVLSMEAPSESKAAPPKKPWEKAAVA